MITHDEYFMFCILVHHYLNAFNLLSGQFNGVDNELSFIHARVKNYTLGQTYCLPKLNQLFTEIVLPTIYRETKPILIFVLIS